MLICALHQVPSRSKASVPTAASTTSPTSDTATVTDESTQTSATQDSSEVDKATRTVLTTTATSSEVAQNEGKGGSHGLSSGAAAGISVGSAAAGVLIVLVLIFTFRAGKRAAHRKPTVQPPSLDNSGAYPPMAEQPVAPYHKAEAELPAPPGLHEMGAAYDQTGANFSGHYMDNATPRYELPGR